MSQTDGARMACEDFPGLRQLTTNGDGFRVLFVLFLVTVLLVVVIVVAVVRIIVGIVVSDCGRGPTSSCTRDTSVHMNKDMYKMRRRIKMVIKVCV